MPTVKKKGAKRKSAPKQRTSTDDPVSDIGVALGELAKATYDVASELRPLYHLDTINDNLANLATATDEVASAIAASVIAQYGSEDDRARIVKHLKGWFWKADVFDSE
jgi:hypothetical protein